jgi:malonate transporter and related proteins
MQPLLEIILPVFGIIGVGYLCGARRLLGPESSAALNLFVYWVALPALVFRAMASVDLGRVFDPGFIAGFLGPVLLVWPLSAMAARLLFQGGLSESTLHGANAVLGNSGFMGIPLAITAWGEAAALPAIVATIVNTAVIPGISIALVETDRGRAAGAAGVLATVGRALATNPMLVAPVLGLLWAATGLALPAPADTFTRILGAAAAPCALFAIGLFLVGKPQSEGRAEVGLIVATKLVLLPALTALALFVLIPVDPLWAKTGLLMAALPTGAGTFVLAQAYGIYVLRTSSAILWGTVLSVATLTALFVAFPPGT